MASKTLINLSNLQQFLSKLNEKFALKKTMKGISEDSEGNIIIGEEGLVPTPNENSKGKFLRSDGEWALPSETAVYDSMTIEEGVAGVSEVNKVLNAKNLKQIVNSDGFLTSLDSSKLTGVINIENLPQGALERILIVSSKEERLTLSDTEVQLGDVVKESDTGLMYYVINTEKLNSEEGYTQFTAGMASSVPWSGVTNKPTIPTKTSDLTNDSGFAIDSDVVHRSGNETISGEKTFKDTIVSNLNYYDTSDVLNVEIPYIAIGERTNGVYKPSVNWKDKDGYILGGVSVGRTYSQDTTASLSATTKKSDGTLVYPEVKVIAKSDGISHATAPTPPSDATGNEIVTAEWVNALDENLVHKTGNETIDGTKTFSDKTISNNELHYVDTKYDWSDTSLNVWCDAGHVAWFDKTGNRRIHELVGANGGIWRKECHINESKYFSVDSNKNISYEGTSLKWNGKNVAIDENLVHTSGDEHINGTKMFSNTIYRYADLTTLGSEQVYRFDDTNANACGHIYNNVHWNDNAVFNRHGAYNAKSGKSMEIDITSNDAGVGMAYVAGTATKGNLETVTSATGHTGIATMGWVNNPATSTNVVHRSGNETIGGTKTFSSKIIGNLQGNADNGIDRSGAGYVKFKDGTQICWGSNKDGERVTFANAFKSIPYIFFGYNISSDFGEIIHGQARYSSSTSFVMLVWNFNHNNWETGRNVEWLAIGRWY